MKNVVKISLIHPEMQTFKNLFLAPQLIWGLEVRYDKLDTFFYFLLVLDIQNFKSDLTTSR